MKKFLLLLSLLVSFAVQAYEPMIREDRVWKYDYYMWPGSEAGMGVKPNPVEMKFSGTTEMNGVTYHNLIDKSDSDKVFALLREEGMKVYRYIGKEALDVWPVYCNLDDFTQSNLENQCKEGEILLYDFGKDKKDFFYSCSLSSFGKDAIVKIEVVKPVTQVTLHNAPRIMSTISLEEYVDESGISNFEEVVYDAIGPERGYLYAPQCGPWVSSDWDNLEPYLVLVYNENSQEIIYENGDRPISGIEEVGVAGCVRNSKMHDLMGREIRNPQRGTIYIQNGVKHIAR